MKELTKEMVTFSIDIEEELTPIQVALSEEKTGADHQEYIDKVLANHRHNPWLWCCVKVTAKFKELEGTAYLGQCAYESYLEFKKGGYYEQMEDEAFEELKEKVDEIVAPFTAPLLDACQIGYRELREFYNDGESVALGALKAAIE